MLKAIRALVPPGAVVEMRSPEYGGRKGNVMSGYYNDLEKLINDARQADGKAAGLYFTMNPVKPELLARRVNRSETYAKLTTADHDIERRRWVLIDIDPIRPAGICSTDAERDAAHVKAAEISDHLARLGFPEPITMGSGNGAYLLYPVDLPNDDASRTLVQGFLNALGERFNDAVVKIDSSVYNAARIIRVPGTLNAKGDSTPDRPHRRARLLSVPENLITVGPDLVASVVQLRPEPDRTTSTANDQAPPTARSKDVTADIQWMSEWLKSHELETGHDEPWKGTGHRWALEVCPFNSDHDRGEAWVCIMPTGARAAGCRHDSCTWKWSDLRAKIEPSEATEQRDDTAARKVADAVGQVRVAQAKLDEARDKKNATASQLLAAEEKLATAQRRLAAAEHAAATTSGGEATDDKTGRPSAATQLVELALYLPLRSHRGRPAVRGPAWAACGAYAPRRQKLTTRRTIGRVLPTEHESAAAASVSGRAARARGHGAKPRP
jgi:hypothetical protein